MSENKGRVLFETPKPIEAETPVFIRRKKFLDAGAKDGLDEGVHARLSCCERNCALQNGYRYLLDAALFDLLDDACEGKAYEGSMNDD